MMKIIVSCDSLSVKLIDLLIVSALNQMTTNHQTGNLDWDQLFSATGVDWNPR